MGYIRWEAEGDNIVIVIILDKLPSIIRAIPIHKKEPFRTFSLLLYIRIKVFYPYQSYFIVGIAS